MPRGIRSFITVCCALALVVGLGASAATASAATSANIAATANSPTAPSQLTASLTAPTPRTTAAANTAPAASASVEAGGYFNCGITAAATITCWGSNDIGQATPPAGTYTTSSSGEAHACAVATDQHITCWGANWNGQTTAPGGTFTAVAAGGAHTCAIRTDQTVACWGANSDGQATPPAGTFSSISAGQNHTCGIVATGAVTCWGNNDYGQTTAPAGTFSAVTAGGTHSCGLRADASVLCWGSDLFGQSTPPTGAYSALAAGNAHTCGIRGDSTVTCWGANGDGQSTAPTDTFSSVTAGWAHTCGLRTDGALACWGRRDEGQTAPPASGFTAVAAGTNHACGLRADQTVTCWGLDDDGQLNAPAGMFTAVSSGTAFSCALRTNATIACWGSNDSGRRTPPAGTFTAIATGTSHGCAIRSDQTVACWGGNSDGQATAPTGTFTAIGAGFAHSCGVRTDGTLACWGANTDGQTNAPVGTFTTVATGGSHSCAIRTDATAACWGYDGDGQATAPAGTFTAIAAASSHTCAIRTDGGVSCWGSNAYKQSAPAAGTFTTLSAADTYACGVRTDTVFNCWGRTAALGDPIIGTPPPLTSTTVVPSRIASTGQVTVWVNGAGLDPSSIVALVPNAGGAAVAASSVTARPGTLEVRFELTGIATGVWKVRVSPTGAPAFIAGTVTVEAATAPDLRVSLLVRKNIRPATPTAVTVTVTNLGNTDAPVVPVYLDGLPAGTVVDGEFDEIDLTAVDLVPGLEYAGDPDDVGHTIDNGNGTVFVPLMLSNVPAGGSVDVTLRVTVPAGSAPFTLEAWATQCLGDVSLPPPPATAPAGASPARQALDDPLTYADPSECTWAIINAAVDIILSFIPGAGCVKQSFETVSKLEAATRAMLASFANIASPGNGVAAWGTISAWAVGSLTVNCAADLFPPAKELMFVKKIWDWGSRAVAVGGALDGCFDLTPVVSQTVTPVSSYDPNEKVGPKGVGPAGYTSPDVPFNYAIYFENKDTATAAAQTVTVTDPIDTAKFDPDTIRLGPVIVGGKVVATPPPGTRDWTTVVPLDGMPELLGIDVAWNDTTDELVWTFRTLDPVTLLPTEDPLAGFLPPNASPPEGEGNVTFFIEPRGRTNGTVLSNGASIVFDTNEPIVTNLWTNTLDGTPPTSAVAPLPATTTNPAINLTWSGSDAISGLKRFQIWVQTDGGPAQLWRTTTAAATSGTFTGTLGHTYAFWSVATDGAGNIEAAPASPDATTTIPPGPLTITTTSLPNGTVGTAYSQTIGITGGKQPYTRKLVGKLPTGVTFNAATGVLSGTPSVPGLYKLTFQVTDSSTPKKLKAKQKLTLQIAPSAIVVAPTTLPAGTRGIAYKATLAATGGSKAYTWTVTAGTLPAGLKISTSGKISGKPTSAGSATFTVRATDKYGYTADRQYTVTVN